MYYPLYHMAHYRPPSNLTIKVENYLLKILTFGANVKTPNFKIKFCDSKKLFSEAYLDTETTEYMYIISFFQITMNNMYLFSSSLLGILLFGNSNLYPCEVLIYFKKAL